MDKYYKERMPWYKRVEKEIKKCGGEIVAAHDLDLGQSQDAVADAVRRTVGGARFAHVFRISRSGVTAVYTTPFEERLPLIAELTLRLEGAPRAPLLCIETGVFKKEWRCEGDPEWAKSLDEDRTLKRSLKGISGAVNIGNRVMAIPWAVHVCGVGGGSSEVAVRVGQMRTLFGRFAYLKEAFAIVDQLKPHLTAGTDQAQRPLVATYGPVHDVVCGAEAD